MESPAGPDSKLPLPALRAAVALLAVVACGFICLAPVAATDFWWQARTGELILRSGIPTRDPFSWTAPGEPWQVHEWLAEVLFYLLYARVSPGAMLVYKAGLAALACALVLWRGWRRSGSVPCAAAGALATAFALRNYADLRPQMISFVLIAALLLALEAYREGRLPALPWLLPFLFLFWTNCHGGVVVGVLLLALWLAGEAVGQWALGRRSPGLPALAAGTAAAVLAACVNPAGPAVFTYPMKVLGHPQVLRYITEWWSPNFHYPLMRGFEVALLGTFGLLAVARGAGLSGGEGLALVAMAHAALYAERNTAAFGVLAGPPLAGALGALLREAGPRLSPLSSPAARAAGLGAAAAALAALALWNVPRLPPRDWFAHSTRLHQFPVQAAALLRQGYFPGEMYNDYVWGGFLIWHLYPQRRVFIDGRAEVYYRSGTFDDEMRIHYVSEGWIEALNRRRVQVVLTERAGRLAWALRRTPGWLLAFEGRAESVFVRAAPRPPGLPR